MNKFISQYLAAPQSPSLRKSSCDSASSSSSFKYKTELCRTFEIKGSCGYGSKCRFAHGSQELLSREGDACKKKKCNGFWNNGCCSYGQRCKFGHEERGWENTACLLGLEAHCSSQTQPATRSKLMRILA